MKTFHFNDRSQGIFAEGYKDSAGQPVGDTFAYMFRAKLLGAAARSWTVPQLAALVAQYSSAELAGVMDTSGPCLRVEYDQDFYGGRYSGAGGAVFVPVALVEACDGNVETAFAKFTRLDEIHIVGYSRDELFDVDGERYLTNVPGAGAAAADQEAEDENEAEALRQ